MRVVVEPDELHVEDEGEGGRDRGHEAEQKHECHGVFFAATELEGVDYEEGDGHDCDAMVNIRDEEWGEEC